MISPLSPECFPFPDLQDMAQLVLRTRGPRAIFAGHRLLLHVDFGDADKIGVFYGGSECPGFGGIWGIWGAQTPPAQ